jgi:hypothetical protein
MTRSWRTDIGITRDGENFLLDSRMTMISGTNSWFWLSLVLLVSAHLSPGLAQTRSFPGRKEFQFVTRDLPPIDKLELLKLKLNGDLWNEEIEASKTLTGTEAQSVATLWRSQTYDRSMAACHNPAYGIKFFSAEKLLVYATLCWDCNNFGFEIPKLDGTQSFDGRGRKGQQLLQVFRKAFPGKNNPEPGV